MITTRNGPSHLATDVVLDSDAKMATRRLEFIFILLALKVDFFGMYETLDFRRP